MPSMANVFLKNILAKNIQVHRKGPNGSVEFSKKITTGVAEMFNLLSVVPNEKAVSTVNTIDCEAGILPDGHLLPPPEVVERMKFTADARTIRRVIIFEDHDSQSPPNRLSRFCGKWKDDRDADDIISEIMEGRQKNNSAVSDKSP